MYTHTHTHTHTHLPSPQISLNTNKQMKARDRMSLAKRHFVVLGTFFFSHSISCFGSLSHWFLFQRVSGSEDPQGTGRKPQLSGPSKSFSCDRLLPRAREPGNSAGKRLSPKISYSAKHSKMLLLKNFLWNWFLSAKCLCSHPKNEHTYGFGSWCSQKFWELQMVSSLHGF